MHAADLAKLDYLRQTAAQLDAAGHGGKGKIVAAAMTWLAVSRDTLYDQLRGIGWQSHRKLRTDKGDSRVSEDEVKAVAGILRASHRQTGKELLACEDAMKMALANGLLGGWVSPTTMLRLMRRYNCHPRQLARPEPHVNTKTRHPNAVWQLDASICVLYYLRNGRVGVMDERKFNVRKPRDLASVAKQRVLRYAITDHTTGYVLCRYYHVSGENQEALFEFLMWAMHRRDEHVMYGVPWMLVWDAGSANQSHAIGALLSALAIRHWAHKPGNPRAKGQVEGVHNVIERKFEGRLTFTRIDSVEQLNAEMDRWLTAFNATAIHSRYGQTRAAMWQLIRQDQLRLCPPVDLCRVLMHSKPVPRVVKGNLTVSFTVKGHPQALYSVEAVPNVRVGDAVQVAMSPYRAPCIFVIGEAEDGSTRYIECEPLATDTFGFLANAVPLGEAYASKPDTVVDTVRKDLNEAAYGERDTLDAIDVRNKGRLAYDGAIDPFKDVHEAAAKAPSHIIRRGTELDVPNPVQVDLVPLTTTDALIWLHGRFGRALTREESAAVRAWYPDGVPETDLDVLVERLQSPTPHPQRPRLQVVA